MTSPMAMENSRGVRRRLIRRRRQVPRTSRALGFTLIETLVAVAIMAAILAVVPGGLVTARSTIEQSEDWLRARLVAEAALSGDLGGLDLVPGSRQGQISGRNWSAVIEREGALVDPAAESAWMPLKVTVTVDVKGGRTLTVATMRIGHAS